MILDTCFLIDLMNNNDDAFNKLIELEKRQEVQKITAISVFELFSGAERSNNPQKEKEKIQQAYINMLMMSLDEKSASKGGELFGNSVKKGKMLPFSDCMIAGIVIANNETLLTRNVKDFSKIEELRIEEY